MEHILNGENMKYYYGTLSKFIDDNGRTATAKQIASLIKRDVEYGKWNNYNGGTETSVADVTYKKGRFTHHQHLFITGKQKEFEELERLIKPIIEVIPRKT